jgi:hypothetical protein
MFYRISVICMYTLLRFRGSARAGKYECVGGYIYESNARGDRKLDTCTL